MAQLRDANIVQSEAVILSEDNDDSPSLHADNNADEAEAPVKKRKQKRTVLVIIVTR